MAILALLPAVGAALVWLPVSVYLLLTGALWQGVVLLAYGVFVISVVDNVLRPILVGKDTRMPDWVVLISTLGEVLTREGSDWRIRMLAGNLKPPQDVTGMTSGR
jgi:predicted PurR-regulated permease PerM